MRNDGKNNKNEAITVRMIAVFFLILFSSQVMGLCIPECVDASTKITDRGVLEESHVQYRHLLTESTKWTGKKCVSAKWYRLNKGDILYYAENKGNLEKLNLAIGYGAISATFHIPMGRSGKYSTGIGKTAKRKGYYRLVVNKKVTMKVKTYQMRKYNVNKRRGEGKWSKGRIVSKKYLVRCVNVGMERKR